MPTHPTELTEARSAVWTAIESHAFDATTLGAAFKRKFKFDGEFSDSEDPEPSISELPAILIQPMLTQLDAPTNTTNRIGYRLLIRVWTRHWKLPVAERTVSRILKALFAARAARTLTFSKPQIAIGFTHLKGEGLGLGPKVTRADLQIAFETCLA